MPNLLRGTLPMHVCLLTDMCLSFVVTSCCSVVNETVRCCQTVCSGRTLQSTTADDTLHSSKQGSTEIVVTRPVSGDSARDRFTVSRWKVI